MINNLSILVITDDLCIIDILKRSAERISDISLKILELNNIEEINRCDPVFNYIILGPEHEGVDICLLLKIIKEKFVDSCTIIITEKISAEKALNAIKNGVDYFISREELKGPDLFYRIPEISGKNQNTIDNIPVYSNELKGRWFIKAFLNNDEALISVRDLSGRYLIANAAFTKLFDLKTDEIINRIDHEILSDITADQLVSGHLKVIKSDSAYSSEKTFQTACGVRHYVAIFFPVRDDNSKTIMTGMIATDITKIKEMEAGLKRNHMELIRSFEDLARTEEELEEKYHDLLIRDQEIRDIFDNIRDVFYRVDENGYITMISPSASEMLGYSSHLDLINQKAEILWNKPEFRIEFTRKLLKDGFIQDYEFIARKADSTQFWASSSVRKLSYDNRTYSGYEGLLRDISERKAFEQEREAMLLQIEKNLGELAILNDGIRNPLTVILGYSGMLPPDLYEKVRVQVKKIDDMVFQLDKQWNRSSHVFHFLKRHYGYDMESVSGFISGENDKPGECI